LNLRREGQDVEPLALPRLSLERGHVISIGGEGIDLIQHHSLGENLRRGADSQQLGRLLFALVA
jgi:hypothetical protein